MTQHDSRPELTAAVAHAQRWLDSLADRRVPASEDAATLASRLPQSIPEKGRTPLEVTDQLVEHVEPGLMAGRPAGSSDG